MKRIILRQILDIQIQAERLISSRADLDEIKQFARYNDELKAYLLANINSDYILEQVNQIPILDLSEIESTRTLVLLGMLRFLTGGLSYFKERQKAMDALEVVRDIRNKYASVEFLLKSYLEE